jgi:hypothetical protein
MTLGVRHQPTSQTEMKPLLASLEIPSAGFAAFRRYQRFTLLVLNQECHSCLRAARFACGLH